MPMTPFAFHPAGPPEEGERRIVVPAHLEEKTALLAYLQRALALPDYFGRNWDALDECLADLAQKDAGKISLIHSDLPLAGNPAEQRLYLQVLADSIQGGLQLRIYFPESIRPQVEKLLRA